MEYVFFNLSACSFVCSEGCEVSRAHTLAPLLMHMETMLFPSLPRVITSLMRTLKKRKFQHVH